MRVGPCRPGPLLALHLMFPESKLHRMQWEMAMFRWAINWSQITFSYFRNNWENTDRSVIGYICYAALKVGIITADLQALGK